MPVALLQLEVCYSRTTIVTWTCFKLWSKRQSQHDSPREFNIVMSAPLPDVWKPTKRFFSVQKLKNTISWESRTRRWHGATVTRWFWTIQSSEWCIVLCCCGVSTDVIFYFSTKTIQRRRDTLGLKSSNQLKATFEMLEPHIMGIRERFPTTGYRQMRTLLLQDYAIKVNEWVC